MVPYSNTDEVNTASVVASSLPSQETAAVPKTQSKDEGQAKQGRKGYGQSGRILCHLSKGCQGEV